MSKRTSLYSSAPLANMNSLHLGLTKSVPRPKRGYLYIADEVPHIPRATLFDPLKHSFNPLHKLDYRKAREIAELVYTLYPQGENTLTVRNGKREMLQALLKAKRLDEVQGELKPRRDQPDEVGAIINDLLTSPVLKRVLCTPTNFPFRPKAVILARINRVELGEFDALALGLFLMTHYKGQLVVPDLGFYGRDIHTRLIREDRLIAGVNHLEELPPKLRQSVLLFKDKVASGASYEDAQTLAKYAGLIPGVNEFNSFVAKAME